MACVKRGFSRPDTFPFGLNSVEQTVVDGSMKKRHSIIWTLCLIPFVGLARAAATEPDALPGPAHDLGEVVVTGTRSETDIRHLPMTVSVVDRRRIEQSNMPSLLPILSERIPGLFSTGRGIMGYGVSGGAAGQMSLRGI